VLLLLGDLDHGGHRRQHSLTQRPTRFSKYRTPPPATRSHLRIDFGDLQYVLFVALFIALMIMAIVLWRSRPGRPPFEPPDDETPDTPAELARAVDSGRQALRELDDARAAIIRCYLAMERTLAEAGAARGIAETPDELLARAVADGLVGRAPASRLTVLFYEARFSTHPMPAYRRDDAEQALAELAATLPDSRAGFSPATMSSMTGAADGAGPASESSAGSP
jgi:hypothetical protein